MAAFVLGYYFYSDKDDDTELHLQRIISQQAGEPLELTAASYHNLPELGEGMKQTACRIELEPMRALIWARPASTASQLKTVIEEMESFIKPATVELMGRLYVLAAPEEPEGILEQAVRFKDKNIIALNGFKWVRTGMGWKTEIMYGAVNSLNSTLLLVHLPTAEMAALRAELLCRYYRDQRQVIDRERLELSDKLSSVLYSTLVPVTRSEEANQLEEHMSELTRGYGVLIGYHRVVQEGVNRLLQQEQQMRFYLGRGGMGLWEEVLEEMLRPLHDEIGEMQQLSFALRDATEDYHAGMEVVRGKIDVLLSRESLNLQTNVMQLLEHSSEMQRQSLTFQFAASLIEFVIVAYYGTSLWKYLAPGSFHALPGWALAVIVLLFSGDAVYLTHLMAERLQGEKHLRKRIIIAALIMALVLAIIIGTQVLSGGAAH